MKTAKSLRKHNGDHTIRAAGQLAERVTKPSGLRIASILAPVDFSRGSAKALAYAASLAEQFNAKITLLYVIEPVALPDFVQSFPLMLERDEVAATCEGKLASLARKAGIDPNRIEKTLVRQGRPHEEIANAARTLKSDIIVISTHGYSGLTHAILGSVTERVVRQAPCPVLVVREKEREFISDTPR